MHLFFSAASVTWTCDLCPVVGLPMESVPITSSSNDYGHWWYVVVVLREKGLVNANYITLYLLLIGEVVNPGHTSASSGRLYP